MFNEKNETLVYKSNMKNNNPLSPHLQIYKWQISSLLSITHRIVGVVNFFAIILICLWVLLIIFSQDNYSFIYVILNSIFGKFLAISLCWTFSFHILNEIRHLFWDAGYGFDLKIAKITGILAFYRFFCINNFLLYFREKFFLNALIYKKMAFYQN